MIDDRDSDVDVGSKTDSKVDLNYQTLLTDDIEPDCDLPTSGFPSPLAMSQ